jgi:hypothetical protein
MALVSPGVEVTIIDESQYLPPASSSVPFVLLATAQNKANATGTAIAPATTAANANKLYTVTSQRDLVNLFGNPFFYKTSNNTPIQGYELNEYGLLAAYSLLGATNRCFILRADIDLASLVGTLSRPTGAPADGTYWLDTTTTTWGIYEFNQSTGKFTNKLPLVITDANQMSGGAPLTSLGTIGSYAQYAELNSETGVYSNPTFFYKNMNNSWVVVGSQDWKNSIPTVTTVAPTGALLSGTEYSFTITFNGTTGNAQVITFDGATGIYAIQNAIHNAGGYLDAQVVNNTLQIYYSNPDPDSFINITDGANTPLATLFGAAAPVNLNYFNPLMVTSPSSQMPLWTVGQLTSRPTGSVWVKSSVSGNGLNPALNVYRSSLASWVGVNVSYYDLSGNAIFALDSTGGQSIPVGTVIMSGAPAGLLRRKATGSTIVTGSTTSPEPTVGSVLYATVSTPGVPAASVHQITMTGSTGSSFVVDWLAADIPNTDAYLTTNGAIQIEHTAGGDIYLTDVNPTTGISSGLLAEIGFDTVSNPDVLVGFALSNYNTFQYTDIGGAVFSVTIERDYYSVSANLGSGNYSSSGTTQVVIPGTDLGGSSPANDITINIEGGSSPTWTFMSGTPNIKYVSTLSNWEWLSYTPNEGPLATNPANGTNWYYSTISEVDIMVNQNGAWKGYREVSYDSNGHPLPSGVNTTDPNGPILATDEPTTQSDGTALVYGDLWIDTNDLENYPMIYRWQLVDGQDQWVQIDNTDQVSQNGVLFADARWGTSGSVDPVNDPIPEIVDLLESNYLDLDAPNPVAYPQGMLLWNTRRSGYNVKQFRTNYFTSANYPGESLPTFSYTWVSVSGLNTNGSAYMGRKAQRNMVVQAMKAAIGTNQTIREEDTFFNLMATPNYPELQPDMVVLNNDRNNTAYIIGDTPLRLPDQATALTNWATNAAGASSTGEDGLVTRNEYMGLFYPSGITVNPTDGSAVVVPASHMMLRTFLRNDTIAYPWLAPAGTRRGNIDNATNIGYLDATTGEFVAIKNRLGIRDVLYTNQINPLAFFTGVGLLNYGNKNSKDTQSALDRINVARLVCYVRERLQVLARPFVFEPNDSVTRNQIAGVVQSLFIDLVAKRGLYDYLVVCDESNNTPARIDRNELWIDVAIEPVKAAEFIYIPVRVLNTGEIQGAQ